MPAAEEEEDDDRQQHAVAVAAGGRRVKATCNGGLGSGVRSIKVFKEKLKKMNCATAEYPGYMARNQARILVGPCSQARYPPGALVMALIT